MIDIIILSNIFIIEWGRILDILKVLLSYNY